MDGVDAAFIETDGVGYLALGQDVSTPFDSSFRSALRSFVASAPERGSSPDERGIEAMLTDLHARAVGRLLTQMKMRPEQVDLIGFHGQTIWHRPHQRETWQMGDAQRLADATGIAVVSDFRTADVKAGGQGAPLVPVFHAALAHALEKPVAIVNIGGVGNVTWIGDAELIAFDTGPGNGLIDDWVSKHVNQPMDEDGRIAAAGKVHDDVLARMLAHAYFDRAPPKSLDRHAFSTAPVAQLSVEDGAATLTAFTAVSIARGLALCPRRPKRLLICGGGRRNPTLMAFITRYAGVGSENVDRLGWRGDAVEAQAFAYLAVRSARGLPITFPGTTGVGAPKTGGVTTLPARKNTATA